jgi:nucleoside-diphosphate-sugar epimerase
MVSVSFPSNSIPFLTRILENSRAPSPTGPYTNNFQAYSASKTIAFNKSLEFMAKEKPRFDLINIHPSFIIGKNELITDKEHFVQGTNAVAFSIVLGKKNPTPAPGFTVHVDDVAKVHVLSLDPKISGNQSFVTSSQGPEGTRWEEANDTVKKYYPESVKNGLLSADGTQPSKKLLFDSSHTEKTFGFKFLSYVDQVKSLVGQYIEIDAKTRA